MEVEGKRLEEWGRVPRIQEELVNWQGAGDGGSLWYRTIGITMKEAHDQEMSMGSCFHFQKQGKDIFWK